MRWRSDTYPRQRQPRSAKASNIREQSNGSSLRRGFGAGDEAAEDEDHAQPLPHGAPEEQFASPGALDDEPADGGEDGVDDHVDAAEEEADVVGLVDGFLEEDWEVVDHGVTTTH